jgi:hypothetical protein
MDKIEVKCAKCGNLLKFSPEFARKAANCPMCGQAFTIPEPPAPGEQPKSEKETERKRFSETARRLRKEMIDKSKEESKGVEEPYLDSLLNKQEDPGPGK